MLHAADDATDARGILLDHRIVGLVDTESLDELPLISRLIDEAPDLGDFNLCHFLSSLTVKHFVEGDATLLSDGVSIPELTKSHDGSLNEVVGVGRTL